MAGFYEFTASLWLYPGKAGWHFITLPQEESEEIREHFAQVKRGWGSLPVIVTIGGTTWKTSIFPDRKADAYLLPIKAEVREREEIGEGNVVAVRLEIR